MSDRERERLGWEMKKIMKEEDSLLMMGLCDRCSEHVRKINQDVDWPEEQLRFEIV
jgi:CRISPR-associated protein Cas2